MGIFIVTALSLAAGLLLSITSKILNSENELAEEITEMLPGYDCNKCGEGNCLGYAKTLLENSDLDKCRFLKEDKKQEIKEYITVVKEDL